MGRRLGEHLGPMNPVLESWPGSSSLLLDFLGAAGEGSSPGVSATHAGRPDRFSALETRQTWDKKRGEAAGGRWPGGEGNPGLLRIVIIGFYVP